MEDFQDCNCLNIKFLNLHIELYKDSDGLPQISNSFKLIKFSIEAGILLMLQSCRDNIFKFFKKQILSGNINKLFKYKIFKFFNLHIESDL